MKNLSIVETADGSKTIFNAEVGEHYHSHNGAFQESQHVFINAGLQYYIANNPSGDVCICEVGFGTGLNFLLSSELCSTEKIKLNYTGIEAHPLDPDFIAQTDYGQYLSPEVWKSFQEKYLECLKKSQQLNTYCSLRIEPIPLLSFETTEKFDIIYFDAFAVKYQPEMWNEESLTHIVNFLKDGGVFVTYAITGNLKRSLKSLGFTIQKIPGAAGKREMLRAIKSTFRNGEF